MACWKYLATVMFRIRHDCNSVYHDHRSMLLKMKLITADLLYQMMALFSQMDYIKQPLIIPYEFKHESCSTSFFTRLVYATS